MNSGRVDICKDEHGQNTMGLENMNTIILGSVCKESRVQQILADAIVIVNVIVVACTLLVAGPVVLLSVWRAWLVNCMH